jgi:probable HAF family extracellular repeat protein
MRTRYGRSSLLVGFILALAACADQPTAPIAEPNEPPLPQFDLGPGQIMVVMEDLGPALSSTSSSANAINNSKQITGARGTSQSGARAYVWQPPDTVTDLGTLGQAPFTSIGYDINDAGVVVGRSDTHAFRWTPPGPMKQLASHPSSVFEAAYGVNNGGTAAGVLANTIDWLVYWSPGDQSYTNLLHPGPHPQKGLPLTGTANDITDALEIVGNFNDLDAFYWSQTGWFTELAELPGSTRSEATAVNEGGVIAGYSVVAGKARAVRWPSHLASPQDLGTLGGSWSTATDINDDGVIVGASATPSGAVLAFRLDPNGLPQNLGAPKGALGSRAEGINAQGHIVGTATFPNRVTHAVAWWNYSAISIMTVAVDVPTLISRSATDTFTVTILSTIDADALQVDASTLTIGDGTSEDVRVLTGENGVLATEERDMNGDGRMDLVVSFDGRQLVGQELPAGEDRAILVIKGALLDRSLGVYATADVTIER